MTEPDHPSFMPILSTFLRQKEEHRRLERLDRLHALQAADALEKVRDLRLDSHEACADLCQGCQRVEALRLTRIPQAYPSAPKITLRVVGGITYLLYIPQRGKTPVQ